MSVEQNVQVIETTGQTILAGAREYGFQATKDSFSTQAGAFRVTEKGKISGDADFMDRISKPALSGKTPKDKLEHLNRLLVQAGNVSVVADHLKKSGYAVKAQATVGKLHASRGQEIFTMQADLDGKINFDCDGYKGNSCSIEVGKVLKMIGKHKVLKQDSKVEKQNVIRTVTNG